MLLALWTDREIPKTKATVATTVLTLICFLSFLYLSHLEHIRSVRPSTLLNVYLGTSLLLDVARLRTLWYMNVSGVVASLFAASFATKAVVLLLELKGKQSLLKAAYKNSSPEAISGIFNRSVFW